MTDALIAAHGEVDKLMPYLHLPVQSGSDRILKAMNRSHTAETYLATSGEDARGPPRHRLVRRLHRRLPRRDRGGFRGDAAASSMTVGYASAYSFKYSARPGTRRRRWRTRSRAKSWTSGCSGCRSGSTRTSSRSTGRRSARDTQILIERKGRHDGQMIGKIAVAAVGPRRNRRRARRHHRRHAGRRRPEQPDRRSAPEGGRLMARRDLAAVPDRARLELEFEQPYLLGPLFGDYDRHLITIENRLGVHIAARGNKRADRGRARCRGARPRRADRPLQPARPAATTSMPKRSRPCSAWPPSRTSTGSSRRK